MNKNDLVQAAPAGLSRRTVMKFAVVSIVGAAVGAGSTAMITRFGKNAPRQYRVFSVAEAALLIDMCEQIIPRDRAPGATDTGAIHYIDWQLSGALARHRRAYHRGLESFRQTCLRQYQLDFQQLPSATKIDALRLIEAGRAPKDLWGDPSAQEFFGLVLAHTMQGFYGSPRHGGNRDYASYRMLGLDYPQVVGQNRDGRK